MRRDFLVLQNLLYEAEASPGFQFGGGNIKQNIFSTRTFKNFI